MTYRVTNAEVDVLCKRLLKQATCLYIVVDASVADDFMDSHTVAITMLHALVAGQEVREEK